MLKLSGVEVCYGKTVAVRDLSLTVGHGEIVFLAGLNGAGKSTTTLAVAGALPTTRGDIALDGRSIVGLPPERIARLGVSLLPEGRHIFSTLTVRENLKLGAVSRRDGAAQVNRDIDRIVGHFPFMASRLNEPAGRLSGGQQQQLAIGRALMSRPRLMIVDEPSLGLSPKLVEEVNAILTTLRTSDNMTLLIVDQSLDRAMRYGDRVAIMRNGHIVLEGTSDAIAGEVMDAYFGVSHEKMS